MLVVRALASGSSLPCDMLKESICTWPFAVYLELDLNMPSPCPLWKIQGQYIPFVTV